MGFLNARSIWFAVLRLERRFITERSINYLMVYIIVCVLVPWQPASAVGSRSVAVAVWPSPAAPTESAPRKGSPPTHTRDKQRDGPHFERVTELQRLV